jgi:hypothetical protein
MKMNGKRRKNWRKRRNFKSFRIIMKKYLSIKNKRNNSTRSIIR